MTTSCSVPCARGPDDPAPLFIHVTYPNAWGECRRDTFVPHAILFRMHFVPHVSSDRMPDEAGLTRNACFAARASLRCRNPARDALDRHPQAFKIIGLAHKGYIRKQANAIIHGASAFS